MNKKTDPVDLSSPVLVGGIEIRNRVFLAPMSGVTDAAFRSIAWKFGAGLVVSEMIASQALVENNAEMRLKLRDGDVPFHMIQLAGREAKWMALAARLAQDNGAHMVDINMGCPAKRVTTGYSGSALMRDLDHAVKLIESVVNAVEIPVTLKMRLGWDENSINASQLASRAESSGVCMITVHGRTRCQFYKGKADWQAIAAVRDATRLPVVVNGDIVDWHSAQSALALSGADAVMIGRGAYGAPWLPGQVAGGVGAAFEGPVSILAVAVEHYLAIVSLFGPQAGIRKARKHLGWYMDRLPHGTVSKQERQKILTATDVDCVVQLLQGAGEKLNLSVGKAA